MGNELITGRIILYLHGKSKTSSANPRIMMKAILSNAEACSKTRS
jgi:hypothetical protein